MAALWLGAPATAALINIDVEGDPPNDTTHSGADGVLSQGGTVWNGIESGVDASNLLDDAGAATGIDVVFNTTGGGSVNASATNDLQDSGTVRTFDVGGLDSATTYDIAVYAAPFSFILFTDASGPAGVGCTGSSTYALPGTVDLDYCLFEDRLPADLGGGEYGFTIGGLDGVIMGVQILGGGGAPPNVPALPLPAMLGLLLGLLAASRFATTPLAAPR